MQLYLAWFFTVAAVATAILYLWPGLGRLPPQPVLYAVLTLALLTVVALLAPTPIELVHKGAIVLGLLIAVIAIFFLTFSNIPPAVGFAHLLITYLLYYVAAAVLTEWSWPTPWEILVIGYGAALYWLLAPRLGELWGTLLGYMLILGLMLWQAVQLWSQSGQPWTALLLVGTLLIVVANSLLALDIWHRPIRQARLVAPLVFFAGQGLVAWSVWGASVTWLR